MRDERYALSSYAEKKGVAVDHDHFTEDDMRRLPYYADFLARFGFRHSANIAFPYNGTLLNFGLQRGVQDDPFTQDDETILVRTQLRLTSAMQVMHGVQAAQLTGVRQAFEIADIACLFFNAAGRVVEANSRAEALLDGDVRVVGGELHGRLPDETKAVRGHLRAILDRRPFTDMLVSSPVVLTRRQGPPLLLRAHRLSGFTLDIFSKVVAVGLLFDAGAPNKVDPSVLHHMFFLTRQEQEIARRIAEGLGIREIAEIHGVDYETVRTHLKNIMRKTETSRQGELVALLNRVAGI